MVIPEQLRYTEDHAWVSIEGARVRVGITDFAQEALGDVVFVELPAVDVHVDAGASLGEVESTKSVSEIYAPVSGTVIETNGELPGAPERINADPYGEGWLCVIDTDDVESFGDLLDASQYETLTATLS